MRGLEEWFEDADEITESEIEIDLTVRTSPEGWDALEERLRAQILDIFKPRERGGVVQWAEDKAVIPATTGQPLPGKYRLENGPVMGAVQDAFTDDEVREMTLLIGAQVGKSRSIWNMIGWIIDWAPGPVTMAYPDDETAQTKMEEDFLPGWAATPSISGKIMPDEKVGKRDKGRKWRYTFPGGWIRFVSTRSNTRVKASPSQYFFIDEHAEVIEMGNGNVDMAGFVRQRQFANPKFVRASTPKGSSKTCPTTKAYLKSDMRKPFVFCPKCGFDHLMEWENVQFPRLENGSKTHKGAWYQCPNPSCNYEMGDAVRGLMIDAHQWRQTAIHECCGAKWDPMETRNWDENGIHRCPTCKAPRSKEHSGFWASALYSKTAGLEEMARQWLLAEHDPGLLQQFINQTLAKNFEPAGSFNEEIVKSLQDGRLDYQQLWGSGVMVPRGVKFLVMSVDVQPDRLHAEIRGYGNGQESWGIKYAIIRGSPFERETWEALHEIRKSLYPGVDGRVYPVVLTGIDIGDGNTVKGVMEYVRPNLNDGVRAIRGERLADLYDPWTPSKKHEYAHDQIGTDKAKLLLDQRLRIKYFSGETPLNTVKPGMMHWPADKRNEKGELIVATGYTDSYFLEATNFQQTFVRNSKTGEMQLKFKEGDRSVREEALDNLNYCNGLAVGVCIGYSTMHIENVPDLWIMPTDTQAIAKATNGSGLVASIAPGSVSRPATPAKSADVAKETPTPAAPRRWKFAPNDDDRGGIGRGTEAAGYGLSHAGRATGGSSRVPGGW